MLNNRPHACEHCGSRYYRLNVLKLHEDKCEMSPNVQPPSTQSAAETQEEKSMKSISTCHLIGQPSIDFKTKTVSNLPGFASIAILDSNAHFGNSKK